MGDTVDHRDVAAGPGPQWYRWTLIGLACLYYFGMARESLHKLFGAPLDEAPTWLAPVVFFTQASSLFPEADTYAIEARLDVWSCDAKSWVPLDPRPYFQIETDDKESRLQRLAYFYPREPKDRVVMRALDDYIRGKHADGADDGVRGKIGGIRLYKWEQKIPAPGEPPLHYEFDPFAKVPPDEEKIAYYTKLSDREARCTSP